VIGEIESLTSESLKSIVARIALTPQLTVRVCDLCSVLRCAPYSVPVPLLLSLLRGLDAQLGSELGVAELLFVLTEWELQQQRPLSTDLDLQFVCKQLQQGPQLEVHAFFQSRLSVDAARRLTPQLTGQLLVDLCGLHPVMGEVFFKVVRDLHSKQNTVKVQHLFDYLTREFQSRFHNSVVCPNFKVDIQDTSQNQQVHQAAKQLDAVHPLA